MSAVAVKPVCGCKSGIDARGREWVDLCAIHQAEHDARHQAAIESCSHVYRAQLAAEEIAR
jgi:hypothetical protein